MNGCKEGVGGEERGTLPYGCKKVKLEEIQSFYSSLYLHCYVLNTRKDFMILTLISNDES